MQVRENAYAKINLTLDVLGKRPDGYHEILTVFQTLALHDTLYFEDISDGEVDLSCSTAALPEGPANLAWRAAQLFREHYGIKSGVHITLEKNIPVAAGLGGGSSDAAAVLRGLLRFWHLSADKDELMLIAQKLGSDVPFCLEGGTALGRGRGERLERIAPCPHFFVVLANPGFAVSTAAVYGAFNAEKVPLRPDTVQMCEAIENRDRQVIISLLGNVLETATFRLFPEVRLLKDKLGLSGNALMCGSGPTVFTLLDNKEDALLLCSRLQKDGIRAWCTETFPGKELGV